MGTRGAYFGCGAFLGFLAGFAGLLVRPSENFVLPILGGLAFALVFGVLAALFGSRFLNWLRFFSWFWP